MEEHKLDEVVAEVHKQIAAGRTRRRAGAVAVVELEAAGDGVLFVRAASPDEGGADSQLRALVAFCDGCGLQPAQAIVSVGFSGALPVDKRPDIAALSDAIAGGCSWVALDRPGCADV